AIRQQLPHDIPIVRGEPRSVDFIMNKSLLPYTKVKTDLIYNKLHAGGTNSNTQKDSISVFLHCPGLVHQSEFTRSLGVSMGLDHKALRILGFWRQLVGGSLGESKIHW
ncbi:2440_t:CDS:2, partial [Gigaspora margarita]